MLPTFSLSEKDEFMETYTVKFLTPGQMVIYKDRRFRTPVMFENVLERDISFFDSQARRSMIKYEVFPTSQKKAKVETIIEELDLKEDEDIEIEELGDGKTPSTILEKLIANNED